MGTAMDGHASILASLYTRINQSSAERPGSVMANALVARMDSGFTQNRLVLSRLSVLRLSEFSVPLLPECLDEFTFRLNEGRVKIHTLDRIDSLLEKSVGTRITYKQLVSSKGSKIHCSLLYADDRGSVSAHAEFSGFPPGILFCAPSTELRTGAHDGAESALRGSITRDDLSRRHGIQVDATTRTGVPSDRSSSPGWSERRPCTKLNRTQYPWECRRG